MKWPNIQFFYSNNSYTPSFSPIKHTVIFSFCRTLEVSPHVGDLPDGLIEQITQSLADCKEVDFLNDTSNLVGALNIVKCLIILCR